MRQETPADWQLPAGVNRSLWDYLHDEGVARNYDEYLQGSSLFELDLRFVMQHCAATGRFLDLGCGTGRLLVALGRAGWERLVGVDLSAPMLAVAREKALQAGVEVDLLRLNLTDLSALRSESFAGAACLFSTLGMVLGEENRRRVVAEVQRVLQPGGRLVLHVHNRWFNLRNAAGRTWLWRDVWRRLVGHAAAGDRVMPVHQGIAGLTLHLFTRREVVGLLSQSGLRVVGVQAISTRADGRVRVPWWFGGVRAYGFLVVAEKPAEDEEMRLRGLTKRRGGIH